MMSITVPISPSFVGIALFLIFLVAAATHNLPYVGHGFLMYYHRLYFRITVLKLMRNRGPVFRQRAFNKRLVIVADPVAIEFIKHPSQRHAFSGHKLRQAVHLDSSIIGVAPDAKIVDYEVLDALTKNYITYLAGKHIPPMVTAFKTYLLRYMDEHSPVRGAPFDLSDWLYRLTFHASAKSLFGEHFPADEAFDHFSAFDQDYFVISRRQFHKAPKGIRGRDMMAQIITAHIREHIDECCLAIQKNYAYLTKRGFPIQDIGKSLSFILFAAHVNSIWLHHWIVCMTSTHPEVLSQLLLEMDAASKDGAEPSYHADPMDFSSVPMISKVLDETLRWVGSALCSRLCTEPTKVPLANGGVFDVREGEIAVVVTHVLSHDPAHYPAPEVWDPIRNQAFLDTVTDGSGPPRYFFGFGAEMCPGRKIAIAYTKMFVATFYERYAVVVNDETPPVPDRNWYRRGIGFTVPTTNWNVEVRHR